MFMKIQWAVTTWVYGNKAGLYNDTAIKWHCGREYTVPRYETRPLFELNYCNWAFLM